MSNLPSAAYLNSRISFISKISIRYEGILTSLDPRQQVATLANVRSHGTEEREAPQFVPPSPDVYEYIIFRAADVKELVLPNLQQNSNQFPYSMPGMPGFGMQGMQGMQGGMLGMPYGFNNFSFPFWPSAMSNPNSYHFPQNPLSNSSDAPSGFPENPDSSINFPSNLSFEGLGGLSDPNQKFGLAGQSFTATANQPNHLSKQAPKNQEVQHKTENRAAKQMEERNQSNQMKEDSEKAQQQRRQPQLVQQQQRNQAQQSQQQGWGQQQSAGPTQYATKSRKPADSNTSGGPVPLSNARPKDSFFHGRGGRTQQPRNGSSGHSPVSSQPPTPVATPSPTSALHSSLEPSQKRGQGEGGRGGRGGGRGRGGRGNDGRGRGGGGAIQSEPLVPVDHPEFDLDASTAQFDKLKIFEEIEGKMKPETEGTTEQETPEVESSTTIDAAYDSNDFFDTLSRDPGSRMDAKDRESRKKEWAKNKKIDAETFGTIQSSERFRRPQHRHNSNTNSPVNENRGEGGGNPSRGKRGRARGKPREYREKVES